MFRGKDYTGAECCLFVENNGYITNIDKKEAYIKAYPQFITDSSALAEYLSQGRFRSEVEGKDWGIEIRIYDITYQNDSYRNIILQ